MMNVQDSKKERDELKDESIHHDGTVNDQTEEIVSQENMGKNPEEGNSLEYEAGDRQHQQESCCQSGEQTSPEQMPSIEELRQQLQKAVRDKEEYISLVQRIQADFDNYRKRNKAVVAESYDTASMDVIGAFLPVLDNLERALDSANKSSSSESIAKGIEMVIKQFNDILKKLGVEEIEALGKTFDPELHNAVMRADVEEGVEENTVVEVLQKGYKYKDKVIRCSMVKVAVKK
jgi:molecular chaperone GrpE